MKPIDLTLPEFQGNFGLDRITKLQSPGRYILPFRDYSKLNEVISMEVDVVFVTDESSRMQVIMVKFGEGNYQDFYYNGAEGCFKLLTEYITSSDYLPEDRECKICPWTFGESWEDEDIGVRIPAEFERMWPKPWKCADFWNSINPGYSDVPIEEMHE